MRILHTADWHLADRLGRVDRTDDLRAAVERVAVLCKQERVDVLLVAGDLFSTPARPDRLQESISHLADVFRPFLHGGGTIVALTGNHDDETFCQTLRGAFRFVSPESVRPGDLLPAGRLHLATGPTFFKLADRACQQVQFACLPYPTGQRYLDESRQRFTSTDERHRALRDACLQRLQHIQSQLDPRLPSVLGAHLYVAGTAVRGLFRLAESDDVCFTDSALAAGWSYVALGHIHQPQAIANLPHARYSGSIERLDQGERDDEKSAVLLDIDPRGLQGDPAVIPLPATPFHDIRIADPQTELPTLADRYPDAARALVKLDFIYHPGQDNLPEILAALDRLFPRCYARSYRPAATDADDSDPTTPDAPPPDVTPSAAMLDYLHRTVPPDDPDRDDLFALARELITDA